MSSVRYELGFYIPEDCILHSHYRETLISYNNNLTMHSSCNSSLRLFLVCKLSLRRKSRSLLLPRRIDHTTQVKHPTQTWDRLQHALNLPIAVFPFEVVEQAPSSETNHFATVIIHSLQYLTKVVL
jgi:hypothetical protein